jgi:hypothetical protein
MLEFFENGHLAMETSRDIGVDRYLGKQDLNCDRASVIEIFTPVDCTDRADTKHVSYFVVSNLGHGFTTLSHSKSNTLKMIRFASPLSKIPRLTLPHPAIAGNARVSLPQCIMTKITAVKITIFLIS